MIIKARRLVLALGLLVGLVVSCQQNNDRVVVEVTMAGFSPQEELDRVEVAIAASSSVQGDALCAPHSQIFAVDPSDASGLEVASFPLRIAVKPGRDYDKILYVRVRGWQSGTLRLKSERMVSLQGGDVRLQILLPHDCLGVGTGAGQHCVGGFAMESPYGPIFDDGLHVVDTQRCVEE